MFHNVLSVHCSLPFTPSSSTNSNYSNYCKIAIHVGCKDIVYCGRSPVVVVVAVVVVVVIAVVVVIVVVVVVVLVVVVVVVVVIVLVVLYSSI